MSGDSNSVSQRAEKLGTLGFIKPMCSPSTDPPCKFLRSCSFILQGRGKAGGGLCVEGIHILQVCRPYTFTYMEHSLSSLMLLSTQKYPNNYFDKFLSPLTQTSLIILWYCLADCKNSISIHLFTLLLFKFSALLYYSCLYKSIKTRACLYNLIHQGFMILAQFPLVSSWNWSMNWHMLTSSFQIPK